MPLSRARAGAPSSPPRPPPWPWACSVPPPPPRRPPPRSAPTSAGGSTPAAPGSTGPKVERAAAASSSPRPPRARATPPRYLATDLVARPRERSRRCGAYHFARPALPLDRVGAGHPVRRRPRRRPDAGHPASGARPGDQRRADAARWSPGRRSSPRRCAPRTGRTAAWSTPTRASGQCQMGAARPSTGSRCGWRPYRTTPPAPVGGWPAWSMWQYTATASVPGIIGDTDLSRFAGDAAASPVARRHRHHAVARDGADGPARGARSRPASVRPRCAGSPRTTGVGWPPGSPSRRARRRRTSTSAAPPRP